MLPTIVMWISPWHTRSVRRISGQSARTRYRHHRGHRAEPHVRLAPLVPRGPGQGPESEAAQRYVFRQGKGEHGELPPTNWLSNFGGSAWESCGDGWYYLHLFAKE